MIDTRDAAAAYDAELLMQRADHDSRLRLRYPRHVPVVSLAVLALWVIAAIVGAFGWAGDENKIDLLHTLTPPCGFGHCAGHLLGTDQFGRDMLARIVGGAGIALIIALLSVGLAAIVGLALGIVAGYAGGITDSIVSRITDVALAFPVFLLALLVAVRFGPSLTDVIVIIAVLFWGRFARVARAETLVLRELDFVESARAQGAGSVRIMSTHILLNVLPSMLVLATLQVGWAIVTEASLSFLGAGVPPPSPAWGSMVAGGRDLLQTAWWVPVLPGLAILIVVVAVNVVGDWLRDRLDPTLL